MKVCRMFWKAPGPPSLSIYAGRRGGNVGRVTRKPNTRVRGKYGVSFRLFNRIGVLLFVRRNTLQ